MKHKPVSQSAASAEIHIYDAFDSEFYARAGVPFVDYCAACRQSAGGGRDFFDFIPLGGDTLVVAMGHTIGSAGSAGLSTAGLRRLMRGLTAANCGPIARVAESLNRAICAISPDPFYTKLFYGWVDCLQSRLQYVSAAQEPALLIQNGGSHFRLLESTGPILGLPGEMPFGERSVPLESGDVLIALSGAKEVGGELAKILEIFLNDPCLRAATLAARILDETGQSVAVVRFVAAAAGEVWAAEAAEPLAVAS